MLTVAYRRRDYGNQHASRKTDMLDLLHAARNALNCGLSVRMRVRLAQSYLATWRGMLASVPASTRRRWRCGR